MNSRILCYLASVLIAMITYVAANAILMRPVSRGSAFRVSPKLFPKVKQNDAAPCFQEYFASVKSECGICGPIYHNNVTLGTRILNPVWDYDEIHYSFEKGGPYYTGRIVENYQEAQEIEVLVKRLSNHGGYFEFRLCNADGIDDPTDECFDHILASPQGKIRFNQVDWDHKSMPDMRWISVFDTDGNPVSENVFAYQLQLPKFVSCKHCILQWRWVGIKTKQVFVGCADISISLVESYYKN